MGSRYPCGFRELRGTYRFLLGVDGSLWRQRGCRRGGKRGGSSFRRVEGDALWVKPGTFSIGPKERVPLASQIVGEMTNSDPS